MFSTAAGVPLREMRTISPKRPTSSSACRAPSIVSSLYAISPSMSRYVGQQSERGLSPAFGDIRLVSMAIVVGSLSSSRSVRSNW